MILVERPAGDPLLGPQLWNEVAAIGSLAPQLRDSLRQHGFRLGHVGSTPPQPLQTMLELTTETQRKSLGEESHKLVGRRIMLASGSDCEIQTSGLYPEVSLPVPGTNGPREETFQHARFVFTVTAERLQDGWARLEFLPQIHHGQFRWRPMATLRGFAGRTAQQTTPLYGQRFTVDLAKGEMAVLAALRTGQDTLGRYFFRGSDQEGPIERLLIVRLANMAKAEMLYSATDVD